jgi:hypothetical protein
VSVGQLVEAGTPPFGVAGTTQAGDPHETQGDQYADRWSDAVVMNAVVDEIIVGDRQLSVGLAAVSCKLDLDPVEGAPL